MLDFEAICSVSEVEASFLAGVVYRLALCFKVYAYVGLEASFLVGKGDIFPAFLVEV